MFDELSNDNEQVQQPAEESNAQQEQQASQQQQENHKEANMRILRERAEAAERRSYELERHIQQNMSQNQQSNKIRIEEDEDDNFGVSDDDYIEGKQFKKYVKSLKKDLKETRQRFEEYNHQSSMTQAEMRLKSQYPDFDAVVSKENLEKLANLKPSLHRTIFANQDIYDRGYTAYEMIKSSGISSDEYKQVDKRLDDNRAKPRSSSNVAPQSGETPLSKVGEYDRRVLSEDRKDQLRRMVEEAKRLR